jgi:hypothetical protein
MGNIVARAMIQQLFSKSLLRKTYGYGIVFLGCRVLSMILMCCKGPIYFPGLLVIMLRLATTPLMAMSTTWDITLRMAFIRSGQHL